LPPDIERIRRIGGAAS